MLSFISGLSQRSGNPATYKDSDKLVFLCGTNDLANNTLGQTVIKYDNLYLITVCPSVLFARSLVPHRKTSLSLSLYPAFISICFPDPIFKANTYTGTKRTANNRSFPHCGSFFSLSALLILESLLGIQAFSKLRL